MNLVMFEDAANDQLLPLVWLRTASELVLGQDRLIDKVITHTGHTPIRWLTRPELAAVTAELFEPGDPDPDADFCLLNTRVVIAGDTQLPPPGVAWMQGRTLVAATLAPGAFEEFSPDTFRANDAFELFCSTFDAKPCPEQISLIDHPWQLALRNAAELERQAGEGGCHEGTVHPGVHMLAPEHICIEPQAVVKPGVVLDAEDGPIHIASGARIEPNAVIIGPAYIGPKSIIRPGATIREGTTIGPVCKVGGEVEGSVIMGYSNKQHDGFLGHSYVANWVNLGADTITSDLKNTYGPVRVFINGVGVESGEKFVGSIIGDHSKTGIGTILPTGCVIGVMANIFTPGAVPKFVPSYAWLTDSGLAEYRFDKAVTIARVVMGRRSVELTNAQADLLESVQAAARTREAPGWS